MSRKKEKTGAAAERFPDRAFAVRLGAITAGALILRLMVSSELAVCNFGRNAVWSPAPVTDMATYMKLAENPWSDVFYYQPWYYSVFLPVAGIFGGGWTVIFAQALLGAAAVWLVGSAGRMLFGKVGGYAAALLTALAAPLCLYTPYHLIATVQSFHFALLLWCALHAVRSRDFRWWGGTGAVLGVAILTRGNAWFFLPVLLAAPFLAGMGAKKGAVAAGLVLALALVVQVPFSWHNSVRLGRLSGPSTAASAVLTLGNSPEAPPGGRDFGLPAGPMEYPEAYAVMMENERRGTPVPRQILAWAVREPGAFLELQFRKLLLFWEAGEIPNNVSITEGRAQSRMLRCWTLPAWIMLALGAAGVFLLGRGLWKERRGEAWVLYGFLLTGWAGVAAFYMLSRFRAPMLPCIAVFAGGWIAWIVPRFRERRSVLCAAGSLAAGLWLVLSAGVCYREFCEARIMRFVRPDGTLIVAPDGVRCRFDHGPRSFGDWIPEELQMGAELEKQFAATPEGAAKQVDWTLFSANPGRMECILSGGETHIFPLEPGENHLVFDLPPGEKACRWRIGEVPPGVYAVRDGQRRYGRSLRDGSVVDGEWVTRWRYRE